MRVKQSNLLRVVSFITIKVLNPIGLGYPDFSMKRNTLPSHPISTLGIRDVPRYPVRDIGMLARQPYPDIWDGIPSWYPAECPVRTWILCYNWISCFFCYLFLQSLNKSRSDVQKIHTSFIPFFRPFYPLKTILLSFFPILFLPFPLLSTRRTCPPVAHVLSTC